HLPGDYFLGQFGTRLPDAASWLEPDLSVYAIPQDGSGSIALGSADYRGLLCRRHVDHVRAGANDDVAEMVWSSLSCHEVTTRGGSNAKVGSGYYRVL